MQDKLKLVNKINSIATIFLFVGIFGSIFFPILKYVTITSSCFIYLCILLSNRIRKGKFNIVLLILCSASLTWVLLREFFDSPYINVFGLVIVYSFLTWSFKSNTGKWNFFVLGYGSLAIAISVINIYIDSNILFYVILALQLYILFKFIDPILEKMGLEHREKRLAHEAEMKRLQEEKLLQEEAQNQEITENVLTEQIQNLNTYEENINK